jgi:hypothetical protein
MKWLTTGEPSLLTMIEINLVASAAVGYIVFSDEVSFSGVYTV